MVVLGGENEPGAYRVRGEPAVVVLVIEVVVAVAAAVIFLEVVVAVAIVVLTHPPRLFAATGGWRCGRPWGRERAWNLLVLTRPPRLFVATS